MDRLEIRGFGHSGESDERQGLPVQRGTLPVQKPGGIAIEGEPRGTRRKAKIISTIFGQILENLSKAHATGIILRDVKPRT